MKDRDVNGTVENMLERHLDATSTEWCGLPCYFYMEAGVLVSQQCRAESVREVIRLW